MPPLAPVVTVRTVRPTGFSLGLIDRLRHHFARTGVALQGQACRSGVGEDVLCDTRLSPEELTGAPSYDPALPFFLQSNFGRNDR